MAAPTVVRDDDCEPALSGGMDLPNLMPNDGRLTRRTTTPLQIRVSLEEWLLLPLADHKIRDLIPGDYIRSARECQGEV